MLRVWLLLMAVVVLAVAAGQVGDSASSMPPRKAIPSVYVCLNAAELQLADTNKAVSVYVDGEGFRPAALYVEGVVVEGRFLNFTEPTQTLIAPSRPQRICLDLPLSRWPIDGVIREAENYAKTRGRLHAVSAPRGRGYILVENRTADFPPMVKWPGYTEEARRETTRDVAPRRDTSGAVAATATGEVVGYIKSVAFNFTRHSGGCSYTTRRIAFPNGTLWIEVVLTNATSRGTYRVYIDLYGDETGWSPIFYDYYGQAMTIDKRSVTYLARRVDIPSSAQGRHVFAEVWICGGPQGVVDGYVLFRVRTSDYYAGYVHYPVQPGARVVVKNVFASNSLNDRFSNTYVVFPSMELPPGHWVGTGGLTADFTIRLCAGSSTAPPPSYFAVHLYYGPYQIGSTSATSQSCGWEYIHGKLYCCRYRANAWSWINAPDWIAAQFGLRAPMGLPIILGPIPTPAGVVYADVLVNSLKYEGRRRPDVAPPDSYVFGDAHHNFAHVVVQYWNIRSTGGTAARLTIVMQYSGGSIGAPFVPIAVSPGKIIYGTAETVYNLPSRVEVALYADAPISYVASLPGNGGTLVSNPPVRQTWESVSAVAGYLGILAQVLSSVNRLIKDPRPGAVTYGISFVSWAGQRLASASRSTYSVASAQNLVTVSINIGFGEAQPSHLVAVQPNMHATTLTVMGVRIWEGSASNYYDIGASSPLSDRLRIAKIQVYGYRNFYCGLNEVPEWSAATRCNYGAFR